MSRTREAAENERNSSVNFSELYPTAPRNVSTVLNDGHQRELASKVMQDDFLTLISVICDIYQKDVNQDLIKLQDLRQNGEWDQGAGHTIVVRGRHISLSTPSKTVRGATESSVQTFVCKRTKGSIFNSQTRALRSLIAELRVRSHPPLAFQNTITQLSGVGWDLEQNQTEDKHALQEPKPLWIEPFATNSSLANVLEAGKLDRLPFFRKIELLQDITKGLIALHTCGIVHGDIKPDNILIFGSFGAYSARISDFGFSVLIDDNFDTLPAVTPLWGAPELASAFPSPRLNFDAMKATDIYSYGLVILSITLGCNFYRRMPEGVERYHMNDGMVSRAIELVEKEDQNQADSDIDLVTTRFLLRFTLKTNPKSRDLRRCFFAIHSLLQRRNLSARNGPEALRTLETECDLPLQPHQFHDKLCVSYQHLARCSHAVKSRIFDELAKLAATRGDPRNAEASWHLCICYFDGFGTDRDFRLSQKWLVKAAVAGVLEAQRFFFPLQNAILSNVSASNGLSSVDGIADDGGKLTNEMLISWLTSAASGGCTEVLPILESYVRGRDADRYKSSMEAYRKTLRTIPENEDQESIWSEAMNDGEIRPRVPVTASGNAALVAAREGSVEGLKAIGNKEPQSLNAQDSYGNSVLMLTARCSHFEALNYLIDQSQVDAEVANQSQQNVLHFLTSYSVNRIHQILPSLLERGADVFHEALPVHYSTVLPSYTPQLRSDSVLNAVLRNNLPLAEALLEASHGNPDSRCRICENGTRYRRIMSIAVSLYRHEVVKILLDHLTKFNKGEGTDVSIIEVRHQQELLPLYKIPFRNIMSLQIDLPECFIRALHYGENYIETLHNTLRLFLRPDTNNQETITWMLEEAVANNCLDTVDFLLSEAQKQGFNPLLFRLDSSANIDRHPLMLSVREGFRDVFLRLWSQSPDLLHSSIKIKCAKKRCAVCGPMLQRAFWCWEAKRLFVSLREYHSLNLTHFLACQAVSSAHQDTFFIRFLLNHTTPRMILRKPTNFDEYFSGEPASLLLQAILTESFPAATMIINAYAALLDQECLVTPFYTRRRDAQNYPPALFSPLLPGAPGIFTKAPTSSRMPLLQLVLLIGSCDSCKFLLRELCRLEKRKIMSSGSSYQRSEDRSPNNLEEGIPGWKRCMLTAHEYHLLLSGLIKQDRPDRYDLWNIVGQQVHYGKPTDIYYLRLALFFSNYHALRHLLKCGWSPNGPWWFRLFPPLLLAIANTKSLEYGATRSSPTNSYLWSRVRSRPEYDIDTRAGADARYFGKANWDYSIEARERCVLLLKERGAEVPKLVAWIQDEQHTLRRWLLLITYLAFYYVLLPLMAFYFSSYQARMGSSSQALGLLYGWVTACVLSPPLVILFFPQDYKELVAYTLILMRVRKEIRSSIYPSVRRYTPISLPLIGLILMGILSLFNHIGLPILLHLVNRPWLDQLTSSENIWLLLFPLAGGEVACCFFAYILMRF